MRITYVICTYLKLCAYNSASVIVYSQRTQQHPNRTQTYFIQIRKYSVQMKSLLVNFQGRLQVFSWNSYSKNCGKNFRKHTQRSEFFCRVLTSKPTDFCAVACSLDQLTHLCYHTKVIVGRDQIHRLPMRNNKHRR